MRGYTIGRAFGIPIRLDLTFLLVLPIFAWIIGSQVGLWVDQLNAIWGLGLDAAPLQAGMTPWLLGIIAAVGLFAGVVLHELGHSLVAKRYGFPIDSITLWLLGGVAQLSDQPEDWRQELTIAIAGPAVSIAIGAIAFLAIGLVPTTQPGVRFVLGYLALMNVFLAAFNLLPGFPMDGGRVLRALLARTRPFARATQIAAEVGKGFALLLGLIGLLGPNVLLIALAFFIYIGASSEAQRTVMNAAFENVAVSDIMTPAADIDAVSPDLSVADLVERMFEDRHTGYPVMDGDYLVGMVTLEDARSVDPVERDAFTVEDIMTTDLTTIDANSNAMDAFDTMQLQGIGRLPVTDEDTLVGLISRTDLMTALDIIQSGGREVTPPDARAHQH
ncbi:MAG: site-2 protease family protein [Halobacteriaceae archaeon]